MCSARREFRISASCSGTKKTVAALTARQYREAKKLELKRLQLQLEMFKDAYRHYKKLYEESQVELKALSERCFMLEQRPRYDPVPTSPDPAPIYGPTCVLPSLSSDPSFVFDPDLTYENWADPVLASLH
ncbi:unnamed protein product [Taenia asiatica]|uniref:BZIP domain-containing protein n=1 Tax=Taenia asiatica TaxID=60517 RepID=A0A0R3VTX5_TAEAS|nr:unnamed protein product [Taenia asiatica]